MAPTDIAEIAARAFAPVPAGVRYQRPYRHSRGHRGSHDRGLLWVRITLFVAVSALLLSIVSSSKARSPADSASAPRIVPDER